MRRVRRVTRDEILDYVTYGDRRAEIRSQAMTVKAERRVHVGRYLTFLFENHDTVRYQIQEMVRVEQMVREADIDREVETYNELLGGAGELGCTLLIEIDDASIRDDKLTQWTALPDAVFLELPNGTRVGPTVDGRQRSAARLSAVQYLKFQTGGEVPVAVGVDLGEQGLEERTELSESQRAALAEDLIDDGSRLGTNVV